MVLSSATKIANTVSTYYFTASSFHVHLLVREKMWWLLALPRIKMWQWVTSFGESYLSDVSQYTTKNIFFQVSANDKILRHEGVWQYLLMDIYNW